MKGWKFSWRAVGAWLVASAITGAVFGLAISLINQWVTPQDRADFFSDAATLGAGAAAVFAVIAGAVFLIGSFLRRVMPWPRPWVDAVILAACLLGLIAQGLSFSLGATLTSLQNTLVHVILPGGCGVLLAVVYWLMVQRESGAGASAAAP